MNNYNSNQLTSGMSASNNIEQKAAQLKQNQQQMSFQNVKQYVQTAQPNAFSNSVEQNAKKLEEQNAKNYIQQMNSKIGF